MGTQRRVPQDYKSDEYRLWHKLYRYGLTLEQFAQMVIDQDNKCRLCKISFEETKITVDHDPDCCGHSAKKKTCGKCNRGLLCQNCNVKLGMLENILYENLLDKYMAYLGYPTGGYQTKGNSGL